MTDYYQLLGVTKESNQSEIKKAYRKLAIQHHPDKGGDPEIFKQVAEAYETLSDPQKKQQYDMLGVSEVNLSMNPMDMFQEFERMFSGSMFSGKLFMDPFNRTTHPFSGFNKQNDPLQTLFMNMGSHTGSNNHYFSQTTIIKNGKKIIKTTQNGHTIINESDIKDNYINNQ